MEEITITTDLVINGNLICGDDGIIEAKGSVAVCAGNKDAFDNIISKLRDRHRAYVTASSDYDISGKIVKIAGHVVVRNGIIYNEAYSGHVSASTGYQVSGWPARFPLHAGPAAPGSTATHTS